MLKEIERIGIELGVDPQAVPGTRSVFAERTAGGYFLDFTLKRENLARYGLTIKEAEMVIMSAVGGEVVSTTVEGRERYTINVRYGREFRQDLTKLRRVLVPTMSGAQIPLAELADIELSLRPGHAPRRKRHALRLRVCGPGRARRGQLRGRRQEGRARRT